MPGRTGASFTSLPDDVATTCLGLVGDLRQRHCALPLVCHRWWRLVNSAEQLSNIWWRFDRSEDLPNAMAFCCWLQRQVRGQVRHMYVAFPGDPSVGLLSPPWLNPQDADGMAAALVGALAQCTGLTELTLHLRCLPLSIGSWVQALTSLRVLHISRDHRGAHGNSIHGLPVEASLLGLTALADMHLSGGGLRLAPAALLPSSLTGLDLKCDAYAHGCVTQAAPPPALPAQQLHCLSQLRTLDLQDFNTRPAELSLALSRLTALQKLALRWLSHLPSQGALPLGLKALVIEQTPVHIKHDDFQLVCRQLDAVVSPLTQLTQLKIHFPDQLLELEQPSLMPPSLTKLTQLRRFCWSSPEMPEAELLPGAWLHGLQALVLPIQFAGGNLEALSAATQLERLGLAQPMVEACGGLGAAADQLEPLLDLLPWAAQHPAMQRLSVDFLRGHPEVDPQLSEAVARAKASNPHLQIDGYEGSVYWFTQDIDIYAD